MKLTDLPNISKGIASDLQKAGIHTIEELTQIGSKDAFIRIRLQADREACVNKLCALEGAIQGIRWHHLSDHTKADLKAFYKSLQ
jgi:DNA transformation protein